MAVTQVFSGDTKDLEEAYKKLVAEDIKLRAELQKTATGSKQHAHEMADAFGEIGESLKDQVKEIGHTVIGLYSIEKAVDVVREAYAEYRAELKAAGEEQKRISAEGTKALALSGDIGAGQRIDEILKGSRFAKPEEVIAAWNEVSGAAPNRSPERRQELVAAAAEAAPFGDVGQLGRLAGGLDRLEPAASGKDLVARALRLQQVTGANADQLTSDAFIRAAGLMQKGGMSAEDIESLGAAALREHISPKMIENLAVGIDKEWEAPEVKPRKRGQAAEPLTKEQIAQTKLAAAKTPQERLALARQDADVANLMLGDKGSEELGTVFGKQEEVRGLLRQQVPIDELTRQAEGAGGITEAAVRQREAEHQKFLANREERERGEKIATDEDRFEAGLEGQGWMDKWLARRGRGLLRMIGQGESPEDLASPAMIGQEQGLRRREWERGFELHRNEHGDLMPVERGRDLGQRLELRNQAAEPAERPVLRFGEEDQPGSQAAVQQPRVDKPPGQMAADPVPALLREQNSLLRRAGANTPVNAHSE